MDKQNKNLSQYCGDINMKFSDLKFSDIAEEPPIKVISLTLDTVQGKEKFILSQRKVVDYTIVGYIIDEAYESIDFYSEIQSKLESGWQPFGDMAIIQSTGSTKPTIMQAMVKYE